MGPGSVVDNRYEIIESVGSGSAAEVYSATDKTSGEQVAIKVQNKKGARNRRLQERFLREARTMMTLDHPNLLKVLDVGVMEGSRFFLVMPLVRGGTLLSRMRAREFPTHLQGLGVVIQLLAGLSVVHDIGVVHRDVKLGNVLVPSWGRVMLGDFGIARMSSAPPLTMADTQLGSDGYMSPEQMDDSRSVGPETDIFALGVVLFQLMARRAAPDLTLADREPQLLLPVPRAVRPVVRKATRYDLADRYECARDMAVDIGAVADGLLTATGRKAIGPIWLGHFDAHRSESSSTS